MPSTLRKRLSDVHPQMLRADSEGDRKKVAVGRRVERTLEILGISKQEAAYQMGYEDAGVISRWCSGKERPQFDKLEILAGWMPAYLRAAAEGDPAIEIETTFRIRRLA